MEKLFDAALDLAGLIHHLLPDPLGLRFIPQEGKFGSAHPKTTATPGCTEISRSEVGHGGVLNPDGSLGTLKEHETSPTELHGELDP